MNFKHVACISALCLAAAQSWATIYPVDVDSELILAPGFPSMGFQAQGSYDDVSGQGSWSVTLDLTVFGMGVASYDQAWTLDGSAGQGELYAATNCQGDVTACSFLVPELSGSWIVGPLPIGSGPFGALIYSRLATIVIGHDPRDTMPGVNISLSLPTNLYECVDGGAFVQASSTVNLINGAELESLAWTVDGQPVASTEDFSDYITLGQHTLKVEATITTGVSDSAQAVVIVKDTQAPVITAFFSDSRTGEVISSIETKNTSFVQSNFGATDACESDPTVHAFGGFALSDGQELKIQGNLDKVELNTSVLEMLVKATDASGNSSEETKTLSISN